MTENDNKEDFPCGSAPLRKNMSLPGTVHMALD